MSNNSTTWSTSCPDWECRVLSGESLITFPPLFPSEVPMLQKKCTKCGELKPLSTEFFHVEKRAKDGFRSICRLCRNADAVTASNRSGEKERIRIYRQSRGTPQEQIEKLDASEPHYKECSKCKELKPATLEHFGPHRLGKYGLSSWCRSCQNLKATAHRKTDQFKDWYSKNKERILSQQKQYVSEKRDEILRKKRERYHSIPRLVHNQKSLKWREKNREYVRQYRREQESRLRENPAYRLKQRISARINSMLKNGKANRTTEDILGFTAEQLKKHIESQFKPGMSWAAFMRGEIHVDHIRPIASFSITSVNDPDFQVCWALDNLQPLWALENISKGCRWNGE